ncbi:MAG: hypothetical protein AABY22_13990 [Nanoarchaeota archaeon]
MEEPKSIKCKLCKIRYVRQQEWKKEFEKQHCATCYAFLKTISSYEKALQELRKLSKIYNRRVRIYLENVDGAMKLSEIIFGKKQYEEDKQN